MLITGAGRAFSSGADLSEQREARRAGPPDLGERLREIYNPIILGIREMPKPVIAAVNGPAVGIGCSLALACDLVLAAESAYFLLAFVNIGLVPDGGATAILPAKVGFARGRRAGDAGRAPAGRRGHSSGGSINRVVADGELEAEAGALLERMADGPDGLLRGREAAANRRAYAGLAEQLDAEAEAQQRAGMHRRLRRGRRRVPREAAAATSRGADAPRRER